MQIGGYELHTLDTGEFRLDGGAMFGVVPKPLWERRHPADDRNRIRMAARVLLARGHGRTILVDTGNGDKYDDKQRTIFAFDSVGASLLRSLETLGIQAGDVTDVLLTHLHFDHAGGATMRLDGKVQPTFPRARYVVQRAQWDAACAPTERDRASFLEEDFVPLREEGVLTLLDGDGELFPGITLQLFHGHTTALQAPLIQGPEGTLLFCADLLPLHSHVQLPWIMGYDLRPLVTLEEKRRILRRAVDERWVLVFEHDPQIAAARIEEGTKGFAIAEHVPL